MRLLRSILAIPLALGLIVHAGSAGAQESGRVEGSGSTALEGLVNRWASGFSTTGDAPVTYVGRGSSAGHRSFAAGITDFAIGDLPYQGPDPDTGEDDSPHGRELAYVPLAAGGVALVYQLRVDGEQVRDLRLSERAVAGIFTRHITRWDDPVIARDNPDQPLPSLPITPVVRLDRSADTQLLTSWFSRRSPVQWSACFEPARATARFPVNCGAADGPQRGGSGPAQVLNRVFSQDANGSIGYVPASDAAEYRHPVAAIGNAAGELVLPDRRSVWAAVHQAPIGSDAVLDPAAAFDSDDPEVYPLSSVAYAILPTGASDSRMTTARRQTLADFFSSVVCDGQRHLPEGFAPLPLEATRAGLGSIRALQAADPAVDVSGSSISICANPSFDPATEREIPPDQPELFVDDVQIDGEARVGLRLRAGYTGGRNGTTITFAWSADGDPVDGGTSPSYVPTSADLGRRLSVTVTAHQPGFVRAVRTSRSVGPVVAARYGIRRPAVKVTRAPTRDHTGRSTITVRRSRGKSAVNAQGAVLLSMRRGSKKVTRHADVRLSHGVGTVLLPRLRTSGRWRATITVLRGDTFTSSQKSKVFQVTVRR